ncbi:hemoglobin [Catalinimonas alkaloidigena]|uniref:Hemoglobin n=1 Tax=Catalinimonas alkaloidigena TaxID=1075417 RepID=A0A1G9RR00_9BACT|nr:group III truncated hemoglobin [Catalinimonas alkaloidigena]SDM24895.1 hemoglobin [Catalinimonas alkaloidigena]
MPEPRPDIQTRADIERMVQTFYGKVNEDGVLAPIFNGVAAVDWEHHLPVMYQFWASMLLGERSYQGNPFRKHVPLPINALHFARWLNLFHATIDELFAGPVADEAKQRATHIGRVFQFKLAQLHR